MFEKNYGGFIIYEGTVHKHMCTTPDRNNQR